ncbi:MAG: hypothetical protein J2P21_22565 [Chloracidobacterium sp.]|nr:hypothetical protein [Chloracidobacterium sp.]
MSPGFKAFQVSGLRLEVGKNLRLDAKLEVGQVSDTTTITADGATLKLADTSTAATGDILTHKEVADSIGFCWRLNPATFRVK